MAESRGKAIIDRAAAANATANMAKVRKNELSSMINRMGGEIAKALPSVITPERFTRIVLSAISTTPKLAECSTKSFLGAMMTAAQLGLEPNTPIGQAYLIPYGGNVQFQVGYKGLIELFTRGGGRNVTAEAVYANDEFEYELGLEPKLVHKPAMRDRGEVIAYYATYHTKDGGFGFAVMSKDDVDQHRKKFSKAVNSPWNTNYDEMAKKTVIKKALKYAPISIEFAQAIAYDENVRKIDEISGEDNLEYIDITEDVMGEDVT